jgi:peptide/nickel transport system substrate-binding protein/oligopeptide transport system substrate-binding protein
VFAARKSGHWGNGPYLDRFEVIDLGEDAAAQVSALASRQVDMIYQGAIATLPTVERLQHVQVNSVDTAYTAVARTHPIKPFDDKRVRQALRYATDTEEVPKAAHRGLGKPGEHHHVAKVHPEYAPLPFMKRDVAKAKALLAEAGHPDGFETQLFAMNTDPNPRIAQAIQQDLAAVGIKANIQSLAQANVIAAGGDKAGAPMIWSGGMAWIADFPDPSNFYGPILGCGGAVAGGWNWSWYCNKDLDAKAAEADSITDPAKGEERNKMWSAIYDKIMEDAPWAPVFNEQRFTIKSPRMGGDDKLYVDPVHIPIQYNYIYVNDVQ